jgi:PAS domain S-box-containing protein
MSTGMKSNDGWPRGAWLRAILEDGSEGVALLDARGSFLYLGPSIETVLGYQESDLIHTPCAGLIHPEDRKSARTIVDDLLSEPGRVVRAQLRIRHKGGTWRWIEGSGRNRLHEPDIGAIVCHFHDSTDITERRRLKQQEQRAQRLENMGALAASIAHDLNNIFTPVLAAGELLRERAVDPDTFDLLDLLQTNARRGAQLVRQIRALARSGGGGRLELDSLRSPRHGATPCEEDATSHTTEVLRLNQGHREGVLLVDDETAVLELLRSILESLNYRVWTASDGAEALQIYRQQADQIRVVVTDLVMPRLDGSGLINCLRELNPSVKIICTTGLTSLQPGEPVPAADRFLPKPFTLGQFIRMLNDQMASA